MSEGAALMDGTLGAPPRCSPGAAPWWPRAPFPAPLTGPALLLRPVVKEAA